MKLFVWKEPYGVSYGSSIAYAVANTEEEARKLVESAGVSEYGRYPKPRNFPLDPLGPPDRVLDLPYAEIYEWSE
jgi:hypothetical protein